MITASRGWITVFGESWRMGTLLVRLARRRAKRVNWGYMLDNADGVRWMAFSRCLVGVCDQLKMLGSYLIVK